MTMVQGQGARLLDAAGAPRSWLDAAGPMRETYDTYRQYANRISAVGYPEVYVAFELLLRYMEERPQRELAALFEDADNLNDQDTERFIRFMILMAEDPRQRLSERTREFICEFRSRSLLAEVFDGLERYPCSIGPGDQIEINLSPEEEFREFEVVVQNAGRYTIDATASTEGFDATLTLRSEDQTLIATDDDGGGGLDPRLVVDLAAGTTYYLRVRELFNRAGTSILSIGDASD